MPRLSAHAFKRGDLDGNGHRLPAIPLSAHLARARPDRLTLLLIAIAILGTGLVLARHVTYGVVLLGDSGEYVSTALGLLTGEGLTVVWQGDWLYRSWPPLYPMLLAAGSLGLFDLYDVAGLLSAACHGLTILVAGQWLRRQAVSPIIVIWGSLAIALSLSLITLAEAAGSDAPFYLLTTLALSRFSAWSREPKRATLLWAAVFTALACLTRYPGIALLPAFVLMLLLQRNTSAGVKVRRIVGYVLISGIPIALYLIRNYFYFGSLTTNFAPEENRHGVRSVLGILEGTLQYIGGWIVPGVDINGIMQVILSSFLIITVMTGFIYFVKKKRGKYPFLIYIASYLTMITVSLNYNTTVYGLEERYISVLYIPFICIFSVTLDGIFHNENRVFRIPERIPIIGGIAGIAVIALFPLYGWLGYNAKLNEEEIRYYNSGEYFREAEFNSEIRAYMKDISDGLIWGNLSPEDAYIHTGKSRDEYRPLPDTYLPNTYDTIPELIDNAAIGDFIIWWLYPSVHVDYTFEDLLAHDGLDFVATLRDGHVLRISKRTHAEKHAAITSREPNILSEFNVYLSGHELSWIREPCRQFEVADPIFVHVIPRNISVLPENRRHEGFDNLSFQFRTTGVIFNGKCMATISLPSYQILTIFTGGQIRPSSDILTSHTLAWSGRIDPPLDASLIQSEYDSITSGEPAAQSIYSVWIDGQYISYTKNPCEEDDTVALFFLHIVAVDDNDLSDERRAHGFDNLDFVFERETGSVRFDGKCITTRLLPDYPIASIHTGQYDDSGERWSVDIPIEE